MKTRREFLAAAAGAASVVLLSACGQTASPSAAPSAASPSAPSPAVSPSGLNASKAASASAQAKPALTKITAAFPSVSGSTTVIWLAKEAGIFAANGLDVGFSVVTGGARAMAALISGETQFNHGGGPEPINANLTGADIVVVGNISPVYPYKLYVPADIKSATDLKGKKVDVGSFGTSIEIATRIGLKKLGLNPDMDVTLVATGTHQTGTAALFSGAVQARMDNLPAAAQLEAHGFHALFDLAALKVPAPTTLVVAQRTFLTSQRAVAQKYADSIVQATARARKDKALTVSVMKKYFKSNDEAVMAATYDYFIGQVTPALPYPRPEQFADAIDFISKTNPKAKGVDLGKLLDPSFVQSAADRGLDKA